jgi:RNA polymerase sigma-70 factor (ECF subfamily)
LLVRVRNPKDREAWGEFAELYGPVVYRFGCKHGLQDADALDLMQIVFNEVAKGIARFDYDRQRGRFSSWLFAVAQNQLHGLLRRQNREVAGRGGDDLLPEVADRDSDEDVWNHQWQCELFRRAAEQVRPEFAERQWNAFWRTAVDGESTKEVAESLGMTPGAIHTAKSRVVARIRAAIEEIEAGDMPPFQD